MGKKKYWKYSRIDYREKARVEQMQKEIYSKFGLRLNYKETISLLFWKGTNSTVYLNYDQVLRIIGRVP